MLKPELEYSAANMLDQYIFCLQKIENFLLKYILIKYQEAKFRKNLFSQYFLHFVLFYNEYIVILSFLFLKTPNGKL